MRIPTAPRHEDFVSGFIKSYLNRIGMDFKEDRKGNLVASFGRGTSGRSIAFGVHMDHPGFELKKVNGKRLSVEFLGGVPRSYFKPGTRIDLYSQKHGGRMGVAEIQRVTRWTPQKKGVQLKLLKGTCRTGDFGMWRLVPLKIQKENRQAGGDSRIYSRACDDLAGCAALLEALSRTLNKKRKSPAIKIYAVFTRREEIGLCGAIEVARSGQIPQGTPVISIETSKALPHAPQGDGPIIRVGDRSSVFDPDLVRAMVLQAGKTQIHAKGAFPFQRKLMDGGTCEATAYLSEGYPSAGICVALGNYHNCHPGGMIAAEHIAWDDWCGMVELLSEWMQEGLEKPKKLTFK